MDRHISSNFIQNAQVAIIPLIPLLDTPSPAAILYMVASFFSNAHKRNCARKQEERKDKLDSLAALYPTSLKDEEGQIHALSLSQIVEQCKAGSLSPSSILSPFVKRSIAAQNLTNCLTDVMVDEALKTPAVSNWPDDVESTKNGDSGATDRLLLGVPISIKDTTDIIGHDSTIGYSNRVGKPAQKNSAIVRLLQDAGALIHVKTTIPTGLIALETWSDLYGTTSNPYDTTRTTAASGGGGAALLACGGSKIEIGSDIAGSVRIPAHFCGIWSLKGSAGRFPSWGCASSVEGIQGIPLVIAPMAGSLDDLSEFWKRVVLAEPWKYDHTCHPIPWKSLNLREEGRKLKWGILVDPALPPTPACARALSIVSNALRKAGHEVAEFQPPDLAEGIKLANQLLFSDGGQQLRNNLSPSERVNTACQGVLDLLSLPRFLKSMLSVVARWTGDIASAETVKVLNTKTVVQERDLMYERDAYRAAWHEKWAQSGLDFLLTVPHPFPAFKHGESEKINLMTAEYTAMFSLLDYTSGVLPVTFVDKELDRMPKDFLAGNTSISPALKPGYDLYSSDEMHGLPVGIQISGQRLEEEKVLEGMKIVEDAMRDQGLTFVPKVFS